MPEARNPNLGCLYLHSPCLCKLVTGRAKIRRYLRATWGSWSQICATLKIHQTEIIESCHNLAPREQLLISVHRGLLHSAYETSGEKGRHGQVRHSHVGRAVDPKESSKAQMNPESCFYLRQKSSSLMPLYRLVISAPRKDAPWKGVSPLEEFSWRWWPALTDISTPQSLDPRTGGHF